MRKSISLIVLLYCSWNFMSACSSPVTDNSSLQSAGRSVGSLRGVSALEEILNGRLSQGPFPVIDISKYLGSTYSPSDLETLMGAFSEVVGHSSQESATPNAVNSLLWQIVMEGLAKDLAKMACLPESPSSLQEEFYNSAHKLCSEPVNLLSAGQDLENFWLAIARYDAPEAEMRAWIEDEQAADGILLSASSGQERVSQLLQSVFLNPYFLLEH